MTDSQPFIDYYQILQVSPTCDGRGLEAAYRLLAKMYHPDHAETADVTKFNEVITAYKALRSAENRAQYNLLYTEKTGFRFPANEEADGEKFAYDDADAHSRILIFLYKRRRENAQDAGVGRYFVQKMLNCSDEHFEFHIWYLKAKNLIETTEQGTLAITIEGVDHVISMSQTIMREKLLIGRTVDP
ncbi:J domain-containing protein [Sphingobium estronivorans]|uniref:J domain-containing protein n=1 Tax=Sphingobium estronivorans TaxID=1577690 RepID=UPI00123A54A6|nr:DnaJ domain-containing protein [Sphingobium estronivorans]